MSIKKSDVRYHLRFQVTPGKTVEQDTKILANECRKHGIEEVVLFFAGEEWNNGLLSKKDENMWFETVKKAKLILNKAGIETSLNPWMTVLHCDRGRRFPKEYKFKPLVSPNGETSKACASFADSTWRDYIAKLYGRFAKLGFRTIWVEDDFRYHNHDPLTWGGGFEPVMIERFDKLIGKKVTRQELVKNILKPGKPHPWRELWMQVWRETKLEVAELLAGVVDKNSGGKTQLGLMSSHPSVHSIEGRDWNRLFESLSMNGKVAHRPHYATYSEVPGKEMLYSIMMLDVQRDFRPDYCEVAPEVENFPFTGWAKSDSQTWSEMALDMFYGSDALLLDLFPFSINRITDEPKVIELLDKSKPALSWIAGKFSKELKTAGVGIPWKQDAAAYVQTGTGKVMEELSVSSMSPGNYLLPYGIPCAASLQPVNAIYGEYMWSFDDNEVMQLLSRGLLLDARSAEILCIRGFGKYVGIDFNKWVSREENTYSIELIVNEQCGVRKGTNLNANIEPRMAVIKPLSGAVEWTRIINPERGLVGAGIVVYKNKLGGRVAVQNPVALWARNYQRQDICKKLIEFLFGGSIPVSVTGGPYLMPVHLKNENNSFIVVFNGSSDTVQPEIHLSGDNIKIAEVTLLVPLEKPVKARYTIKKTVRGITVIPQIKMPYRSYIVVEQHI